MINTNAPRGNGRSAERRFVTRSADVRDELPRRAAATAAAHRAAARDGARDPRDPRAPGLPAVRDPGRRSPEGDLVAARLLPPLGGRGGAGGRGGRGPGHRRGDPLRPALDQGPGGLRGLRRRRRGAGGDPRHPGGLPGAAGDHRRLPLRVHLARALRRRRGRRGAERPDAGAPRAPGRLPRPGRRPRGRALGHDGRPGGGDSGRPRRRRIRRAAHPLLRRQVRVRLLRPLPRGRGLGSPVRRPARVPDGPRQRARGAPRGPARRRGGRGHRDGEARAARTST